LNLILNPLPKQENKFWIRHCQYQSVQYTHLSLWLPLTSSFILEYSLIPEVL